MDNERIDFSSLDPQRNSARFEQMIRAVMAGVTPLSPPIHPFVLDVTRWGRTVLAAAALVAVVSWTPKMFIASVENTPGSTTAESMDPWEQVSSWAHAEEIPAHADVSQVLGGLHAN